MTYEEILKCSADQLEKMTDAELLEHFRQKLSITRPSPELRAANQARKDSSSASSRKHEADQFLLNLTPEQRAKADRAREIAASLDMDFDITKLKL